MKTCSVVEEDEIMTEKAILEVTSSPIKKLWRRVRGEKKDTETVILQAEERIKTIPPEKRTKIHKDFAKCH